MPGVADGMSRDGLEARVAEGARVAVDAEAEERVRDHLREVLVGEELADQQQALECRAGRGEDLEVRIPGVGAQQRRDLVEVLALEAGVLRARLEPDAVPVALVDEAPVAVAVAAQAFAHTRVA